MEDLHSARSVPRIWWEHEGRGPETVLGSVPGGIVLGADNPDPTQQRGQDQIQTFGDNSITHLFLEVPD